MTERPQIVLQPRAVNRFLFVATLLLLIGHIAALIMTYAYDDDFFYGLVPLFNFALEKNAPTYFSTLLLLLNGGLFFIVWTSMNSGESYRSVWLMLAIVFCFLSLDEFATLHELLINPVRRVAGASGPFYFAWIIPYGLAVVILGLFVAPAIWRLGRRFFVLFASSAACYVGGAIGIEMIEGAYVEQVGYPDMTYRMLSSFQELLEILGLLILVHTLLLQITTKLGGFAIVIASDDTQAASHS